MDPNPISPKQAVASLANIAPFLWPFVLLSLGVALTPVSPISWSYSTWLLFAIPLVITVFAPIRSFSGPLRFAYLEYASKIAFWTVSLLKGVVVNFQSIPTLALPALFFLPVLPILFFVVFPALPVIWHYIAYHYRRRLKAVTTSVDNTNVNLDLAIARARQATTLAHTYEKQTLCFVSTTRTVPMLVLPRHSTDFGTPTFNDSEGRFRLVPTPGTLGADLAEKVVDTEKQMAAMEDASQRVRALSGQAVAVATEGHMAVGEELAENAANVLESVLKQLDELQSSADQARCMWVEFRRRLKTVTTVVDETNIGLDAAVARAKQETVLAQTYEKQALYTVSTSRTTPAVAFPCHSADFGMSDDSEGRPRLVFSPGTLGAHLAGKVLDAEKQMASIEDVAQSAHALSAQAVVVATEGDMVAGEELAGKAANLLESVVKQLEYLHSTVEEARCTWVEFRRRLKKITTTASTTTASLDFLVTRARQATTLAHTYEDRALVFVSTTRRSAAHTLALHDADFFEASPSVQVARQTTCSEAERVRALGRELANNMMLVEANIGEIESVAYNIRSILEQAVNAAVDGDVAVGESLAENAADAPKGVAGTVMSLCSASDDVRQAWVQLSLEQWSIP